MTAAGTYRERLAWVLYQAATGDPAPYIPGDWPGPDSERCYLRQADIALAAIAADQEDRPLETVGAADDVLLRTAIGELVGPGGGSLLERVPAPMLSKKSRDALVWAQVVLGHALHATPTSPTSPIRDGLDTLQGGAGSACAAPRAGTGPRLSSRT